MYYYYTFLGPMHTVRTDGVPSCTSSPISVGQGFKYFDWLSGGLGQCQLSIAGDTAVEVWTYYSKSFGMKYVSIIYY